MNKDGAIVTGKTENGEVVAAQFRSGPLPTAHEMQEYNDVVPGLANVITDEFKKQGSHRRWMEKSMVMGQLYLGPILAFSVIVAALFTGYKLLMNDKAGAGLLVSLAPLATLGGLFVWNKNREKDRKDED